MLEWDEPLKAVNAWHALAACNNPLQKSNQYECHCEIVMLFSIYVS